MSDARCLRLSGALLAAFGLSACYEYVPLQSSSAPNPRVEVLVTDRGRVELLPQLGQGVLSFEGILDGRRDSSYVVHVAEVTYINRQTNRWSGEAIAILPSSVRDMRVRRLSRVRTFAVVAGSVGAGLVFALTRGLLGLGDGGSGTTTQPPQNQ
jgi:hypothetical protein